ncbi:MAG: hypothetical protein A2790_23010 [Phenylobacterium sp. RIFCSPHIGHO2_01_FULL_69_31]|uniref:M10 family metallopeptidase n=1 Tax=Phenylobacterium sp. RIFCSPHIGHO2_01_FULL_69_31 TaxID=1801944 RepID=UPI0008B7F015|nr:M10 family metallopeptidase [Phenylobacterium sp. RIFCSPHIGHO2_01_FULL_69_31]OHB30585.1 MAG: hypothetical protein A2790_23010 [Phenylobacterium sp. RIFCSPHIGHO2_01_FULL_69_31]
MANPIPSGDPSPPTGDPLIDALTTGFRWTLGPDRSIDWSISGGFNGEAWTSPTTTILNATAMLETFSRYADVRFNYVGSFANPTAAVQGGSEINFYLSGNTTTFPSTDFWARAYFPTSSSETAYVGATGDVVLNFNSPSITLPSYDPGSAGWFVFLHEIGHALGLKHPFDDGGTGHPTLEDFDLGDLDVDWATIMAYSDSYDYDQRFYDPATPMILDVMALRALYGPNMATNATDDTHSLRALGRYETLWDASGRDILSAEGSIRGWYIYLPDDQFSLNDPVKVGYATPLDELDLEAPGSLTWLLGDIEDARGSEQADEIYGSVLRNVLAGNGGDDYLDGWDGDDSLDGGAGSDIVWGGLGNDTISDASGANYLRGEEGDDRIAGGSGFDDINGNMGADTASGGLGEDWVVGGKDNDSLSGDAAYDLVYGNLGADTCEGGDGNDIVRGGQDNDLVRGGAGDDYVSGDKGNDTVTGGAGADIFHSFGDAGIDRVTDFSRAQGDRVLLDAGTTYTVAQAGADTVVSMTGGGQVILVGVSLSSLGDGWITAG